jgi:hypothetical protein
MCNFSKIIFVKNIINYSMISFMKNALQWLSQGKPTVAASYSQDQVNPNHFGTLLLLISIKTLNRDCHGATFFRLMPFCLMSYCLTSFCLILFCLKTFLPNDFFRLKFYHIDFLVTTRPDLT